MSDISAAVMSCDRPDSRLEHILDRLAPLAPTVVRDRGNPWMTARAAWAEIRPGASHHLVVQDDVRVSASLPDVANRLANVHSDAGIAFFALWDTNCGYRVRMGALGGDGLVEASARDHVPSLALLLPRSVCEAIAAKPDSDDPDDDEVIAELVYRSDLACRLLMTVPNLVEHDDDPSIGFNSADGLRRAACYRDSVLPPFDGPVTLDGAGWDEISVVAAPTGTRLDWGIYYADQPRRMRQIHLPWRMAAAHIGLAETELLGTSARLLDEAGHPHAISAHEFVVACMLHGLAWRHWWRGGRPLTELNMDATSDAAWLALWRSAGNEPSVLPGTVVELAWRAARAGGQYPDVPAQAVVHARLEEWFHHEKRNLPKTIWGNVENREHGLGRDAQTHAGVTP